MPENSAEMFDRVRLMARIDTDWDLSDNDTAALRHVLAAAEAHEAIPGDSLSTTVEKLREACRGVRVEPKPDAPTAAEVIEAAERERDELLAESAYIKQQLEWVKENGDTYQKSALMDFIRRTIHGLSHTAVIKEALAARDARQKKLGAAEWLENAAREGGYYERSSEGMLEEAKQLREGK